MPPDPTRIDGSGPLPELLQRELAMLAPILDGVFGVCGLHVRPHRGAPNGLPPHLLNRIVDLALDGGGNLHGETVCAPVELPFASESFKLVIAQHVLEQAEDSPGFASELARVLAPEGVALLFGFNPVSLWRPWLRRRLPQSWWPRAAAHWRDQLARAQLDVLQVRYSGVYTPWGKARRDERGLAWLRPLGRFSASWLLLARKRRSTLTPLRLANLRSELKLNPSLVPGAQRQRA